MISDNRLYKSLDERFINNDPQYNYGGWAPQILFPGGKGMMEMRGGCGLGTKNISTLDFDLNFNGTIIKDYSIITTSRISFCFDVPHPQPGMIWDFNWIYPSGWSRCGNYWDEVVVIITDFFTEDAVGKYWNAVYYFYREGVIYDTIVSYVEFRKTILNNGCDYNVVFTPLGLNRTDNVSPSPTPTPTPSSTPIP